MLGPKSAYAYAFTTQNKLVKQTIILEWPRLLTRSLHELPTFHGS